MRRTYAADAASSSVFRAPVNKPKSVQNATVKIAMTPRRALVSAIALKITTDKIGMSEAMQMASKVTKWRTDFLE